MYSYHVLNSDNVNHKILENLINLIYDLCSLLSHLISTLFSDPFHQYLVSLPAHETVLVEGGWPLRGQPLIGQLILAACTVPVDKTLLVVATDEFHNSITMDTFEVSCVCTLLLKRKE